MEFFKKYIFWIGATVFFIFGVLFAIANFDRVFSIVNLDVLMNRKMAIESAKQLRQKLAPKPILSQEVAFFSLDNQFRNYVELEGGGKEVFLSILKDKQYSPYTWQVRFFQEGIIDEVCFEFTPAGEVYGFSRGFREDAIGKSLARDEAEQIAKVSAKDFFKVDFDKYQLLETTSKENQKGRKDYTFVYEKLGDKLGEAAFRLTLRVCGAEFAELTHSLKIPEAFLRKFLGMRASNELIAQSAYVVAVFFYVFGGVIGGLFLLLRKRWVVWKAPLICGLSVAFLELLSELNYWPLVWLEYDTALSAQVFFWMQISDLFWEFMVYAIIWTISFMAAESLTRKAFPAHIQFWKIWSPGIANSFAVLGRTIGGYLLLGFSLPFIIVVYIFGSSVLGWWLPSDTLVDPNILAAYFPWVTVISSSLRAGFWEECLFRAVPIAGAALIGQKLGKRNLFVFLAIIFQAIVFGALHANYSQQPSYARIVELFIPAVIYGGVYTLYGLLPVIIWHFAYDAILFSLPLFVAKSADVFWDRVIVVLLILLPLLVVIYQRVRFKSWMKLDLLNRNANWALPLVSKQSEESLSLGEQVISLSAKMVRLIGLGTVFVLLIWLLVTDFTHDASSFKITKAKALAIAKEALSGEDISKFTVLAKLVIPLDQDDRFVWQKEGTVVYADLLGNYLCSPYWLIRFVKFQGEVVERAREYEVFIDTTGKIFRLKYIWPESQAGVSLEEAAALQKIDEQLNALYHLSCKDLKNTLSKPFVLPSRRDWVFEFAKEETMLSGGQKRFCLRLSGDKLTDYYSYIYIPEVWLRMDQQNSTLKELFQKISKLFLILLVVFGVVLAIIRWNKKQFSYVWFKGIFIGLLSLYLLEYLNTLSADIATYSTAEPLLFQFFTSVGQFFVGAVFISFIYALLAGMLFYPVKRMFFVSPLESWTVALSVTMVSITLLSLTSVLLPAKGPFWPDYSSQDATVFILQGLISGVKDYIKIVIFLYFVFSLKAQLKLHSKWGNLFFNLMLFSLGLLLSAGNDYALIRGIVLGVIFVFSYAYALRFDLSIMPLIIGFYLILKSFQQLLFFAYPYSCLVNSLFIFCLGLLSFIWHRYLNRDFTK